MYFALAAKSSALSMRFETLELPVLDRNRDLLRDEVLGSLGRFGLLSSAKKVWRRLEDEVDGSDQGSSYSLLLELDRDGSEKHSKLSGKSSSR